ncbi:hypothetical protein [Rugosimonospora africana]|uniref:Uncharacterized protein n=1 Tax=Rugosimonospora africana TaxID=556532 RepID=A0A8J3QKX4_9ACTN|nr:hypothetical protein [Rugosimonospora africana]GIH12870.1 hypothetical protein Raf01_10420 [Rugosimonospora africana]
MAESGRTGAASTSAVGSSAVEGDVVRGNAVSGNAVTGSAAKDTAVRSIAVKGTASKGTAAKGTAVDGSAGRGRAADSITVVLRGADTARVRMPTQAERDSLGLDPDVPVWVISRADGGTEVYPGDSTVVAPAG